MCLQPDPSDPPASSPTSCSRPQGGDADQPVVAAPPAEDVECWYSDVEGER